MSSILEVIRKAEKGSDIYHLIEKVAVKVQREYPDRSDEENWFEAQARINNYFIEEKLAERCYEKDPARSYAECLEEARSILESVNLHRLTEPTVSSSELEIILKCNLKYFSNYYFKTRKKNEDMAGEIERAFQDWQSAIDCVAYNISLYS